MFYLSLCYAFWVATPKNTVWKTLQHGNEDELLNKLIYEHRTQKFKIWMDGFDDVWLGKREIVETKINYIHNNPLQAHWALVESPTDYEYSSAKFYYFDQKQLENLIHYRGYF
ncbi:MAG: putative transposase [Spirosomataceae bacterium]|jgi:putative transposase